METDAPITVQIIPTNTPNKEKAKAELLAYEEKAIEFLKSVNGIIKITPLSDEQLNELLHPWLGDEVSISDLPTPRIIDVKIAKNAINKFQVLSLNDKHSVLYSYKKRRNL